MRRVPGGKREGDATEKDGSSGHVVPRTECWRERAPVHAVVGVTLPGVDVRHAQLAARRRSGSGRPSPGARPEEPYVNHALPTAGAFRTPLAGRGLLRQ